MGTKDRIRYHALPSGNRTLPQRNDGVLDLVSTAHLGKCAADVINILLRDAANPCVWGKNDGRWRVQRRPSDLLVRGGASRQHQKRDEDEPFHA